MDRVRLFSLLMFSAVAVYPLAAQNENAAGADQLPTFKANVRTVLVDVVVTNSKDEPVTGLTKDQFQVLEDGKPQTLASFEEHAGIPDVPDLSRMAKLPTNVFSNAPLVKTDGLPAWILRDERLDVAGAEDAAEGRPSEAVDGARDAGFDSDFVQDQGGTSGESAWDVEAWAGARLEACRGQ